jgi:RimJ/RimL family protein N-acetyltransferase
MAKLIAPFLPPGTMSDRQQPVVRVDDQFVLRPWPQEDVPALVAAFDDPDIQHWNLNSFDEAGAKRLVAKWNDAWSSETGAYWAIARSLDHFAIGQVGLRVVDLTGGAAEIWYWIAPEARGVGVASLATNALSVWLFEDLGLHRLELGHSIHNPASCHVASNAGYALEGTKTSALLHSDGWHDMHWHARVNDVEVEGRAL